MYNQIINPNSGRKVSIYSKIGRNILRNYLSVIGGSMQEIPASIVVSKDLSFKALLNLKQSGKKYNNFFKSVEGQKILYDAYQRDIIGNEYQVYRMLHPDFQYGKNHFNYEDSYICARYTRESGSWPNEKYYTTERPRYVGRYVRREEFGYGDQSGGTDYFDINGKSIPIEMNYEGRVCFKPVHPAVVPYYNYLASQEV